MIMNSTKQNIPPLSRKKAAQLRKAKEKQESRSRVNTCCLIKVVQKRNKAKEIREENRAKEQAKRKKIREQTRERVRKHREKKKQLELLQDDTCQKPGFKKC